MKKGDKKKQQKALARRTERKKRQRTATALSQVNPALRILRQARAYPFLGCWTQPDWDQNGLAVVIVARRQPDGLVAFGTFLVDYYCLGVKNAYANADVPLAPFMNDYIRRMLMGDQPLEITPDLAHELIYGSVGYAARWGFRPHSDFKLAQQVLDLPEAHLRTGQVEFGKDGKPLYVSGPDDNVDAILRQLTRTAGEGNFHYIAAVEESPLDLFGGDVLDPGDQLAPRKIVPQSDTIFQIKVTLSGSEPPIWRRIQVPASVTLADLHDILQAVMGWEYEHLHAFKVGKVEYGPPDPGLSVRSEKSVRLDRVVPGENFKFQYEYDFGDSWEHVLQVEKVLPSEPGVHYPRCLDGQRACPPEDVGGIWGYAEFVEAIRDPQHPQHGDLLDWIGGEFDPEAFDPEEVNRELAEIWQ